MRLTTAIGIFALGGALLAAAAGARPTQVRLAVVVPASGHAGTAIRIDGRARGSATRAELEQRTPAGWRILATTTVRGGAFTLRWTPRAAGFVTVRVRVDRLRRRLATSRPAPVLIGAAPVYCAAPAQPSIPPGQGAIVGGVYNRGGPAPGIFACEGQANTVRLSDSTGATVATRQVAAGQSYAFVVRPGRYALKAGFCGGVATVTAGRSTHADTVCDVP